MKESRWTRFWMWLVAAIAFPIVVACEEVDAKARTFAYWLRHRGRQPVRIVIGIGVIAALVVSGAAGCATTFEDVTNAMKEYGDCLAFCDHQTTFFDKEGKAVGLIEVRDRTIYFYGVPDGARIECEAVNYNDPIEWSATRTEVGTPLEWVTISDSFQPNVPPWNSAYGGPPE